MWPGWFVLVGLLLVAGSARAAEITGTLLSADARPLIGIELILKPSGATTTTDGNGEFRFDDVAPGDYLLALVMALDPDFRPLRVTVRSDDVTLEPIRLAVDDSSITVETYGGRPFIDESPQVSAHSFSQEQVKTTPGGFEDVARTVATLPGVVAEAPFTSLLYIRGGDPGETASYLDRLYLAQSQHWGGVFTIFNNDLIDNVDFYAGGFPARYSNVLSGVLDVSYRSGSMEGFEGAADLSLISSKLTLEGTLAKDLDASYLIGLRRTYIDALLRASGLANGETIVPYFGDYYGKLHFSFSEEHALDVSLLFAEDGAEIEEVQDDTLPSAPPGSAQARYHKLVGGVKWLYAPNSATLLATDVTFDTDRLVGDVSGTNPYSADLVRDSVVFYSDLEIEVTEPVTVRTGLSGSAYQFRFNGLIDDISTELSGGNTQLPPEVEDKITIAPDFGSVLAGAYVESAIDLGTVRLLPGIRTDYWDYNDEWSVSPRLAVSVPVGGDWTLKASGGSYVQYPADDLETEEDYGNPDLTSEKSLHAVLGAEGPVGGRMKLRLEGWYKDYSDLIMNFDTEEAVTEALAAGEEIFRNVGEGEAYGLDLFWQRRSDGVWDAWVSYGLMWVRRYNPLHEVNSKWYAPRQDQRHTLSAVANVYPWERWRLGAKFQLQSGRPYTPITAWERVRHPLVDTFIWSPIYGDINSATFPTYHSLDVRVEYRFGKDLRWGVYLDVMNVYNAKNVYNYTYEGGDLQTNTPPQQSTVYNLPIIPFIGVNVEF